MKFKYAKNIFKQKGIVNTQKKNYELFSTQHWVERTQTQVWLNI